MDHHGSPAGTSPPEREGRFRALFDSAHDDLLRFVQRRTHPSHAEDVVADALLVAWRRFDEAPRTLSDQRAWLYGIARGCLLNARRGDERRGALAVRLASAHDLSTNAAQLTSAAPDPQAAVAARPRGRSSSPLRSSLAGARCDPQDFVAARVDLARAWQRLSPDEQEVLALSAFEGLTSPEAGRVLGISSAAVRLRLVRARRALRVALDAPPSHLRDAHLATAPSPDGDLR